MDSMTIMILCVVFLRILFVIDDILITPWECKKIDSMSKELSKLLDKRHNL